MVENGANTRPLVVVGGGTAGLTAVDVALELGAPHITLIEQDNQLGGECANYACVPTKAMLMGARRLYELRYEAPAYGVSASPRFDFATLMRKKTEIVYEGGYAFLKDPRIQRCHGKATFHADGRLCVDGAPLDNAENAAIILALGSRASIPPIEGLETVSYWTYREATWLDDKSLPHSLLILGGGAVGVEFAYMMALFGVETTLLDMGERLLANEEPVIAERMQALLEKIGVRLVLGVSIAKATEANGQVLLSTASGDTYQAERLLLATGTKPATDGIHLEAAGIQTGETGLITVDDTLQTTNPAVWAVGDCVGPYRFTHTGDRQAELAVHNAMGLSPTLKQDWHAVPWAVYTHPSAAHVGLTTEQARAAYGHDTIDVLETETDAVSRYRIASQTGGIIRVLVHRPSQRLVGAHLFATEAEELAQALAIAIQNNLTVSQILDTVFIYPARSQLIQKPLEAWLVRQHQ